MLQQFHGQTRYRQTEALLRKLQSQNLHLERLLKEKDREVDQLKNQILNYEARLQELMGTDELTGLPNRHVFKEHLTHSLKRAVRLGYSLSLMLIDIDHLREINLKHGHEIGDKVLIEVANVLRTSVREIVVAERVRKKIAAIEVKDPKSSKPVRVTATLALASYPRHSNDPQALLECVCEALITAKDKGVNSVIIAAR
jgi:PleD family two-component response regulator